MCISAFILFPSPVVVKILKDEDTYLRQINT